MSNFSVPIKRIRAIEVHPNADAIELAVIDGYRSIVKKGEFAPGDLVAYIPEASVLPEWLLQRLGFWDTTKGCGKLNGKAGNRVKAIRLRGELSQGVCYPVRYVMDVTDGEDALRDVHVPCHFLAADKTAVGVPGFVVQEGDDVAALLGITKYEPPVPIAMAGEVFNAGQYLTMAFDVENWKSYPDILQTGESVVFTEKLHGSFCGMAVLPVNDAQPEAFGARKNLLVFSKGLGAQGLVFKNNAVNTNNVYVRATHDMLERLAGIDVAEPLLFLGEVTGQGVQDLHYDGVLTFRLFAVVSGYRGQQSYKPHDEMQALAAQYGLKTVPILYQGPFSIDKMRAFTDGQTTLGKHLREGIVMVPTVERNDPLIGRVALKSVSADYLTRKGGTEFN